MPDAAPEGTVHPDYALIRRALAGDAGPLMQLVERLTPTIRARVARSLGRGRSSSRQQEAADMTQDVFERLFADGGRALKAWNPDAGSTLDGFVRLIAQRQVASILRCKRRTPFEHEPCDPVLLEEHRIHTPRSFDSELVRRERLQRFLQRLGGRVSARGLDVFQRLFVDMESPQRVALALNLSLDSVYQWRSRLAKLVREGLSQEVDSRAREPGSLGSTVS